MSMTQQRLERAAVFEWADRLYELRDIDGNKIGDAVEVNPDYLVAVSDGGFLGLGERRRYYVPMASTDRDPEGQYRVSIIKDDAPAMAWGQPPAGATWSSPAWRARLRADYPAYDEERSDATRLIRWVDESLTTTTMRS
ncbi:MAG: hypothetical protein ABWZ82_11450 [Candidatus Limnocylindrales bacterium]